MADNVGNRWNALGRQNTVRPVVLLTFVALVVAACGTGNGALESTTSTAPVTTVTTKPDDQLANLAEARDLWAGSAPADYTVPVAGECDGCAPEPRTLAVRDGEVVSLGPNEQATIEEMFTTIEDSLRSGATVQVEYHDQLGYPRRIVIDLDGDGSPDIDLELGDIEEMPIVETLAELRAARAKWEAQELDDYTYIFRAECTCEEGGTFEVTVESDRVKKVRPLDEAAERSSIYPGELDTAFDDLELWFTDSGPLIDEGILDVDVRMDPHLGYPRWFRVEGADIDSGDFSERFIIVVTIDLVTAVDPAEVEPTPDPTVGDLDDYIAARAKWVEAALNDYRYLLTIHCECPAAVSGPFEITVRNGEINMVAWQGDDITSEAEVMSVNEAFDLIEDAINEGTDVSVDYDADHGYPQLVLIDPEAVAVDGGLAFTISDLEPIAGLGFISGKALAGPQCPVQQDPPQPGCEDKPVAGAKIVIEDVAGNRIPLTTSADGTFYVALDPGDYLIGAELEEPFFAVDQPFWVTVRAGRTTEALVGFDTGMR